MTARTLLLLPLALLTASACSRSPRAPMNPDPATNTYAPALNVTLAQFTKTPSGLYLRDDTVGTGTTASVGQTVEVRYTGWLTDGTQFDSNADAGDSPLTFPLGTGRVIRGWDEGVAGMRVGGVRTLVIPPKLGYGSTGSMPDIPPYSVLVFRVRLLGVR